LPRAEYIQVITTRPAVLNFVTSFLFTAVPTIWRPRTTGQFVWLNSAISFVNVGIAGSADRDVDRDFVIANGMDGQK
jgi:hypothetical protein